MTIRCKKARQPLPRGLSRFRSRNPFSDFSNIYFRPSARVNNGTEVSSDPTKMLQDFTSRHRPLFRRISDAMTLATSTLAAHESHTRGFGSLLAY